MPPQPKTTIIPSLVWTGGIGIVALVLYALWVGRPIFQPLFIAILLAVVLDATAKCLTRLQLGPAKIPGPLAMALAIASVLAALWLMTDIIAGNVSRLTQEAPRYQENMQNLIARGVQYLGLTETPSLRELISRLSLSQWIGRITRGLTDLVGDTFSVLLFTSFILLEQRSLLLKLDQISGGRESAKAWRQRLALISELMQRYIGTKALMSAIVSALTYVILWMAGVDFPGFWALIAFILNFIPYIGSMIAVLFPFALSLIQFPTLITAFIVLASLTFAQILVGNIIEPRIVGRSLNLSPLFILLGLILFGSLWGVIGAILSVPFMVVGLVVLAQAPATRPLAILLSANGNIEELYRD